MAMTEEELDDEAIRQLDEKEFLAALLFDSEVWSETEERPSEGACHALAEEIQKALFPDAWKLLHGDADGEWLDGDGE